MERLNVSEDQLLDRNRFRNILNKKKKTGRAGTEEQRKQASECLKDY